MGFKGQIRQEREVLQNVHGKSERFLKRKNKKDRGASRGPVPNELYMPRSGRVDPFKTCTEWQVGCLHDAFLLPTSSRPQRGPGGLQATP